MNLIFKFIIWLFSFSIFLIIIRTHYKLFLIRTALTYEKLKYLINPPQEEFPFDLIFEITSLPGLFINIVYNLIIFFFAKLKLIRL